MTAFPQTSADREGYLKVMLAVLDDVSDAAVRDTAIRYAKGLVVKQSKTFAPTPAEFASECREFDNLVRLRNRKPLPPPPAVKRGSYFQRQEATKAKYVGFKVLAEGLATETYQKMLKRKSFEHPHFFVASLGTVYGGLHPALAGEKREAPRPYAEQDG